VLEFKLMELIDKPLSAQEISGLRKEFGDYIKLTVDVEKKILVAGCKLHADGERLLLDKGSVQGDIWGGGIDLVNMAVDTMAVLNIRPSLDNDSMDILDSVLRRKFLSVVESFFGLSDEKS